MGVPSGKTNKGNESGTKDLNPDDMQYFATIIEELRERMKKFEEERQKN